MYTTLPVLVVFGLCMQQQQPTVWSPNLCIKKIRHKTSLKNLTLHSKLKLKQNQEINLIHYHHILVGIDFG